MKAETLSTLLFAQIWLLLMTDSMVAKLPEATNSVLILLPNHSPHLKLQISWPLGGRRAPQHADRLTAQTYYHLFNFNMLANISRLLRPDTEEADHPAEEVTVST